MKTEAVVLALGMPLVWGCMWCFLRRQHIGQTVWHRLMLAAAWIASGYVLRAVGADPHIPGYWEPFLFPILPFLNVRIASMMAFRSEIPLVYAEVLSMIAGFAIAAECVLLHRFIWTTARNKEAPEDESAAAPEVPSEALSPTS